MTILNHHIHLLAAKGITNAKVGIGSTPDYAHWEKGDRWGHIDLHTGRITEFDPSIGRHKTL